MYDKFNKSFQLDNDLSELNKSGSFSSPDSDLKELMNQLGGQSFNQGLYRIISPERIVYWNEMVALGYPNHKNKINCFGMDWLGRIFALSAGRLVENKSGIVLFEPGTAQVLNIPCNLESFHETGLRDYYDAALAASFHKEWLSKGGTVPNIRQCIGYKVPLYLGGGDNVSNLELSDLEVYWGIAAQLMNKTRGLPAGAKVNIKKID